MSATANVAVGPNRVVAGVAVFGGAALLVHIVIGVKLLFSLIATVLCGGLALALLWGTSSENDRSMLIRRARLGAIAGVIATVAYDATRFMLSRGESFPYDPYEAIRAFGGQLLGSDAPLLAITAAGAAFHVLNGVSFGLSFVLLFRRPGVLAGTAWGLMLEAFQLALYPGWLEIRAFQEFVQLSAISHVAYGASLGLVARRGTHWGDSRHVGDGGC